MNDKQRYLMEQTIKNYLEMKTIAFCLSAFFLGGGIFIGAIMREQHALEGILAVFAMASCWCGYQFKSHIDAIIRASKGELGMSLDYLLEKKPLNIIFS